MLLISDIDFKDIYVTDEASSVQENRYKNAVGKFKEYFNGKEPSSIFSAPGRTEVGGNHTDHQHGEVLAASINKDAIAVTALREDNTVNIFAEGFGNTVIGIDDLSLREDEKGTTPALIRGVLAGLKKAGFTLGGFDAYITSDVLIGAGLSSSAAFETLIGTIVSGMFNNMSIDPVEIAKTGQYAENVYFGKPCGLMDQMACSVGNIVSIDFKDPAVPVIERIDRRFEEFGYALCIIDTHSGHADLTDDYASIPREMGLIARHFGKDVLRDVDPGEFGLARKELIRLYGERPVRRAEHFYKENTRAEWLADSLKNGEFDAYLYLVNESGRSSEELLQNIVPSSHPENTAVKDSIELARKALDGRGAVRVHGGGFAGTIQAYVPLEEKDAFREKLESVLGSGSCHYLKIAR